MVMICLSKSMSSHISPTPDYLWDYFFVNNQGGKKDLTKIAEDALKHYNKVKSQINDT